jgi:CsoR family transcriptional regulator, copper-sensing transcriptional repressor
MEYEFKAGRLYLHRAPEEKAPLLLRLRRIEGQVRGLMEMIEANRYCLDEVQQANAVSAAVREVAMLIIADHVTAGVDYAVKSGDTEGPIEDVLSVLRAAMRQRG